ncbi:DUF2817 domain-containing protein [Vibrio astriarenae]
MFNNESAHRLIHLTLYIQTDTLKQEHTGLTMSHLPREIEHILNLSNKNAQVDLIELAHIQHENHSLPLYALNIGAKDPTLPCLVLTGSIHGVERIGSQIILAFIKSLMRRIQWDKELQRLLTRIQIIAIPVVNPWGVALKKRANHNGVDLMRNAPVNATNPAMQLYAGQTISSKLPWFRGNPDNMEKELTHTSNYLLNVSRSASSTIVLDLHSGFGTKDRLWFPFAHHKKPPDNIEQYYLLYRLFRKSYPHYELYQFEPQWHQYTTHGDFWDWQYLQHFEESSHHFLPLTLELGSWLWVKKNPMQLLSFSQLFHPTKPHRIKRVQRRHSTLLNYLMQVLDNRILETIDNKEQLTDKALKLWYP